MVIWWHVPQVWNKVLSWVWHYMTRNISKHANDCCEKAARQLNALSRISKHLFIKSCRTTCNTSIISNLNYCPLVQHISGHVSNQKCWKRSNQLRLQHCLIVFPLTKSCLIKLESPHHTLRLITLYYTMFTYLFNYNRLHINDMFIPRNEPYNIRDSNFTEQSRCKTTHLVSLKWTI